MPITIDKNSRYAPYSPVCSFCQHFAPDALLATGIPACQAFGQIPLDIWTGKNGHTSAYPGDQGIRFLARSGEPNQ